MPGSAAAIAPLSVRGLRKRFEALSALDGVDLSVEAGEVRGLLGPNGAGKTTLLRVLLGLVRPDSGTIEILGRADGGQSLDGVAGFVEEPGFYPYLSGRANLEILAELDGGHPSAQIEQALRQVGLGERAEDSAGVYSTGMRQRLGLAGALMRAPRVLLLDEPTSGLDPAGIRFVGETLRSLAADGAAVLLSSHLIGELHGVCDSFTLLSRGRVVWDGSAAKLRGQAGPGGHRLSTSDDARALELAAGRAGLHAQARGGEGLLVQAEEAPLDAFVLALGAAGIAVRALEPTSDPLESLFFSLTAPEGDAGRLQE